MLKIYMYKGCESCRKALQFLDARGIQYTTFPIREQPPSRKELHEMIDALDGDIQKLFNSSGGSYRSLNLKSRMRLLSTGQKVDLLARDGSLVKRPFAIGEGIHLVGFNEAAWEAAFP